MIGTIVNVTAILTGSIAGSIAKKGLKEKYQDTLYVAMGLAAAGLGLHAAITNMSESIYPVLFIMSLAIGGLIGSAIDIEGKFNKLVNWGSRSKSQTKEEGKTPHKPNLAQGLSTAIVLFCFGTLSILGPIDSALYQNETYLFTNATLDLVTSLVLASTYGIGIALSAAVLFAWQGSIFLLAHQVAPLLSAELMTEISIVGGFLILSSGLSILKIKSISVMNFLPALLVPVVWFAIMALLPI